MLPDPASKKQVKQKTSRVKKNIARAFKGYERFKPRLREQKLRGAYESYIIKGVEGVEFNKFASETFIPRTKSPPSRRFHQFSLFL